MRNYVKIQFHPHFISSLHRHTHTYTHRHIHACKFSHHLPLAPWVADVIPPTAGSLAARQRTFVLSDTHRNSHTAFKSTHRYQFISTLQVKCVYSIHHHKTSVSDAPPLLKTTPLLIVECSVTVPRDAADWAPEHCVDLKWNITTWFCLWVRAGI